MLADKSKLIWTIFISFLLLIITSNNIRSILNYRRGIEKIKDKEIELAQLQAKNKELKENIEKAQTPEYQQKLAIEELNLTADQTTILIIPEENEPEKAADDETYSLVKTANFFDKWVLFLKLK